MAPIEGFPPFRRRCRVLERDQAPSPDRRVSDPSPPAGVRCPGRFQARRCHSRSILASVRTCGKCRRPHRDCGSRESGCWNDSTRWTNRSRERRPCIARTGASLSPRAESSCRAAWFRRAGRRRHVDGHGCRVKGKPTTRHRMFASRLLPGRPADCRDGLSSPRRDRASAPR